MDYTLVQYLTVMNHRDTEARRLNEVTEKVIGCAIEVYKHLGPGLLESVFMRNARATKWLRLDFE